MPSTYSSYETRSRSRKPPRDEYHGAIGVKKITVFKNGDPYHKGIKVVINSRQMHDFDVLLNTISERIDLSHGAKRLFTTAGKQIKAIKDLEDAHDYVASSGHFTPLRYGSSTVVRRPRSPTKKEKPKREKKPRDERVDVVRTSQSQQPRPKKKKKLVKKRAASTSPRMDRTTINEVIEKSAQKAKVVGKKMKETASNAASDGHEVAKKKSKKVKKAVKKVGEKAAKVPGVVAAGASGAVAGAADKLAEEVNKRTPSPNRTHSVTPRSAHSQRSKSKDSSRSTHEDESADSKLTENDAEPVLPSDSDVDEKEGGKQSRRTSRGSDRESKENSRPSSRGSSEGSESESEEKEEKDKSRRGSRVSEKDEPEKKAVAERPPTRRMSRTEQKVDQRKGSVSKKVTKQGTTNWGDLSSFTRNIESLLKK